MTPVHCDSFVHAFTQNPLRTALLAVLVALTPGLALAQASLDEIVVTAQKREERAQNVPISIAAIAGASLDLQSSRDFRDVLRGIAGVSFAGNEPGQTRYTIRGVSTAASSPTTGVYLDDLSLISISTNFAGAIDPPIFDLERIEVLKGPQGTLYGGSAMGGAIKYVSRKPELRTLSVDAAAGLSGSSGAAPAYDGEIVMNAPLAGSVAALRLGILYRHEGGFVDSLPDQQGVWLNRSTTSPPAEFEPLPFASGGTIDRRNANERDNTAARIALLIAPVEGLTIQPSAIWQKSDKDNPNDFWTNLPHFRTSYRMEQPTTDEVQIYSLAVTREFSRTVLTALSGYFDRSLDWERDYTYFVAGFVPPLLSNSTHNISSTTTKTFSQELRLASRDSDTRLRWVLGGYYSDQSDRLYQVATTAGAGAFFGTGTDIVYIGDQTADIEQYAAFGDVSWKYNENWEASVGLRWFRIRQTINGTFDGLFNGGPSAIVNRKSSESGVNPKFSVSYRPTEGHLVYLSASKGFRPGGPNRFNTSSELCGPDFENLGIDRVPATFNSDNLWTYELGSKNVFNGERVLLNGAAYYTDWKNIQQQINLPSCGFQFIANIGAAEIRGAELEFRLAATAAVTIGANLSYTDSEITRSASGVSAGVGQPVLDTPKWSGNAFVDVELPELAGWLPGLHLDYGYRDRSMREFDSVQNVFIPSGGMAMFPNPTQFQQSYDVANASLTMSRNGWQAKLYLNNIADSVPYLDYQRLLFTPNATTLRPRTIGVMVRRAF